MIIGVWVSLTPGPLYAAEKEGRVDVILWFDTEGYLLPASDDAAKRLAELILSNGAFVPLLSL